MNKYAVACESRTTDGEIILVVYAGEDGSGYSSPKEAINEILRNTKRNKKSKFRLVKILAEFDSDTPENEILEKTRGYEEQISSII